MKILVIDNYDSFTYNLVQLVGRFTPDVVVRRNDRVAIREIRDLAPDKIIISPGPGRPEESNISLAVITELGQEIPVLGVCLGHQSIGICFGANVVRAPYLMHGKISRIRHDNRTIFRDLKQDFPATRYHSLIIDRGSLNGALEISAETEDGLIMGVRHKKFPIEGIQFHPESFLTLEGGRLIKNWLEDL
jgi:anthranilate synthase/aminodeoxychorismate synthase-like glutamine amidotransferase